MADFWGNESQCLGIPRHSCCGALALWRKHASSDSLDGDGLRLDVVHQPKATAFTADARLLGSAERHVRAEHLRRVDVHVASIEVLSNAQSTRNGCCEDAS
jgi:hypothetical protein